MKKLTFGLAMALASTTALPAISMAEEGDWLVRARGIYVSPDEKATISAIGGTVDISNVVTPELDFTYFWTDNIATELILATTRHSVMATGTTLGDVDLGKVSLLPPTFLLQYHFSDMEGFKPYLGAGVNLTLFYNEDAPGTTVTDIDYANKLGFALQAGVDIPMSDTTYFNVDVKKLFLKTDVSLNAGAITADVDINPWVFGVGFGIKF